ncbi:MAG: ABC transporter ATP-binding protein [Deltaproteobacteria bacterium]|nr:MAG: ABC transporter ATP-binding protein [Deltaproteobacteria bacterium]
MIQVQNLAKFYGGKRALGPVSFDIEDGECVGFLGLNGAGKTTALRILACDLRPSSGSVRVGDIDAVRDPHEVRKLVGFLPETPPVYPEMTVGDYLAFAGRLRGMGKEDLRRRIPEVEDLTHLRDVHDDLIATLSHGYRQRVGVAQAIVHNPTLLILDEPTRGLDPVQIVEMRNMIRALRDQHTVILSSHVLTEVSKTCDRLLVLGNGTIVGSGSETDLSADVLASRHILVAVRPSGEVYRDAASASQSQATKAIRECVEGVEGVTGVTATGVTDGAIEFDVTATDDVRAALNRALVEAGHDVIRLDRVERELENIFLQLVHGGSDAQSRDHLSA